jgi:hypothetical protein
LIYRSDPGPLLSKASKLRPAQRVEVPFALGKNHAVSIFVDRPPLMEILWEADHFAKSEASFCRSGPAMLDVLMLALLAAAFLGAVGYVRVCERLVDRAKPDDEASA